MTRFGCRLRLGPPRQALALEVSKTGLLLADAGRLAASSTLRLRLHLPELPGAPIGCYATVVHRAGSGRYGIRFVGLSEGDAFRIEGYIGCRHAELGLELAS